MQINSKARSRPRGGASVQYMNYNTYGLTGTLGSQLESDLLRAIYEVETHDVPTFKEKQFEQYETTITNSEAEQQAAIIKAIKQEIEGKGRAVLVICQTIKQAQDLYVAAKSFTQVGKCKNRKAQEHAVYRRLCTLRRSLQLNQYFSML